VTPVDKDTDSEEYVLKYGEETLSENWKYDIAPRSTFVWQKPSFGPAAIPASTGWNQFENMITVAPCFPPVPGHVIQLPNSESEAETKDEHPVPEHVAPHPR
jgi:hypothetical protein